MSTTPTTSEKSTITHTNGTQLHAKQLEQLHRDQSPFYTIMPDRLNGKKFTGVLQWREFKVMLDFPVATEEEARNALAQQMIKQFNATVIGKPPLQTKVLYKEVLEKPAQPARNANANKPLTKAPRDLQFHATATLARADATHRRVVANVDGTQAQILFVGSYAQSLMSALGGKVSITAICDGQSTTGIDLEAPFVLKCKVVKTILNGIVANVPDSDRTIKLVGAYAKPLLNVRGVMLYITSDLVVDAGSSDDEGEDVDGAVDADDDDDAEPPAVSQKAKASTRGGAKRGGKAKAAAAAYKNGTDHDGQKNGAPPADAKNKNEKAPASLQASDEAVEEI